MSSPAAGAPPLVLLVDDYEDNRRLFAEYLELSGFRTAVAGNGAEGLAKANALHPEVIVMDLAMPDLDGFEVTRRLRADEGTRRTPVIALTAYPMGYSRHAALAAGCDAYLTKPCGPRQLLAEIRRLLDAAR
ncbi:MAG: response regulator [Acidobacteria bacterium]|nr:MAG: response regulator [Acidobacteriota bacterium]